MSRLSAARATRHRRRRPATRPSAIWLLLAVVGAGLAPRPAAAAFPSVEDRLRYDGVGEVEIGMPLWELLERLETEVTIYPLGAGSGCTFVVSDQHQGIAFMLIDGRVARTDVDERGYATFSGVRVGDSEAQVMAAYPGRVRVSAHKYTDGHYLSVERSDGERALVFETDGDRVVSYRIGRRPEAMWIEGCS